MIPSLRDRLEGNGRDVKFFLNTRGFVGDVKFVQHGGSYDPETGKTTDPIILIKTLLPGDIDVSQVLKSLFDYERPQIVYARRRA